MPKLKDSRAKELSDKVVIATTTFYKPDLKSDVFRAESTKGMIRSATDLGYKVVVVDGGSSDELLKEFERYGADVYVDLRPGMGCSRRQAIRFAYNAGREIIAWTEPEKEGYIKELVKTVEPMLVFLRILSYLEENLSVLILLYKGILKLPATCSGRS